MCIATYTLQIYKTVTRTQCHALDLVRQTEFMFCFTRLLAEWPWAGYTDINMLLIMVCIFSHWTENPSFTGRLLPLLWLKSLWKRLFLPRVLLSDFKVMEELISLIRFFNQCTVWHVFQYIHCSYSCWILVELNTLMVLLRNNCQNL